jgi:hypothetical protein
MRIEVLKLKVQENEFNDIQYFRDLKVMCVCVYLGDGNIISYKIKHLREFVEEFNKINMCSSLQYLFIKLALPFYYEFDDEDLFEICKILNMLKVPFGCEFFVKFKTEKLIYTFFHNRTPQIFSSENLDDSNYDFKELFLKFKRDYSDMSYFKSKNIKQLVEIQKLIDNDK